MKWFKSTVWLLVALALIALALWKWSLDEPFPETAPSGSTEQTTN